jgi:hypothetical protein
VVEDMSWTDPLPGLVQALRLLRRLHGTSRGVGARWG